MCGIADSRSTMRARRRGESISGSPPVRMASRTAGVAGEPVERRVQLRLGQRAAVRPHRFPPEAEAAIDRAGEQGLQQRPVGVAVDHALDRGEGRVGRGVGHLARRGAEFGRVRQVLPRDRVRGVGRVHQAAHRGRHGDGVARRNRFRRLALRLGAAGRRRRVRRRCAACGAGGAGRSRRACRWRHLGRQGGAARKGAALGKAGAAGRGPGGQRRPFAAATDAPPAGNGRSGPPDPNSRPGRAQCRPVPLGTPRASPPGCPFSAAAPGSSPTPAPSSPRRGYAEVETPCLVPVPGMEVHLRAFRSEYRPHLGAGASAADALAPHLAGTGAEAPAGRRAPGRSSSWRGCGATARPARCTRRNSPCWNGTGRASPSRG